MPPPAPSPQRSRRRRGVLLGAAALLLLIVAAAVVFRTDVAGRAAIAWLEAPGVAVRSLTITELTPGAIEVSDLALGEARALTVDHIRLEPRYDGLDIDLGQLRIAGLRLHLDLHRSAERRVRKECVSTCRARWAAVRK